MSLACLVLSSDEGVESFDWAYPETMEPSVSKTASVPVHSVDRENSQNRQVLRKLLTDTCVFDGTIVF